MPSTVPAGRLHSRACRVYVPTPVRFPKVACATRIYTPCTMRISYDKIGNYKYARMYLDKIDIVLHTQVNAHVLFVIIVHWT